MISFPVHVSDYTFDKQQWEKVSSVPASPCLWGPGLALCPPSSGNIQPTLWGSGMSGDLDLYEVCLEF